LNSAVGTTSHWDSVGINVGELFEIGEGRQLIFEMYVVQGNDSRRSPVIK
jgi:hypothetical protein